MSPEIPIFPPSSRALHPAPTSASSSSSSSSKSPTNSTKKLTSTKPKPALKVGMTTPSSSSSSSSKTTTMTRTPNPQPGGSISRKDRRKGLQATIGGGIGAGGQGTPSSSSSSLGQSPSRGSKRANGTGPGIGNAGPGTSGKWHKNKSGSESKGSPRFDPQPNQAQNQNQNQGSSPKFSINSPRSGSSRSTLKSTSGRTPVHSNTPSTPSTSHSKQDAVQTQTETPDSQAGSSDGMLSGRKSSAKRHKRREKKKNRTGMDGEEVAMSPRGDEGDVSGSLVTLGNGRGSPGSPVGEPRGLGGSGSKHSPQGRGGGQGQARVDVQDEAGRSIGLGSQDIVPHLSGLIKLVSDRLGLDKLRTGLRLVHLRGQGQIVPIFDQPDYKYFLERSRMGGIESQVLQVQVYPKEIVRSGSGPGSRAGEKKRKRSDSSSEGQDDEDESDEDEVEESVQRVTKSASDKPAASNGKKGSTVQPTSLNPSPAQKNKMDQPSSSTPSSSSTNDPTTSDPDSPSPAPRRNIIPLGSRFKPAKPSPLGGTVVARSPTASIGTNGSDAEDEDVVMEDVTAVPHSPAVAGKKGKKSSKSATPASEKKNRKTKQTTGPSASPDLDGFARAISEFAAMLPSVTTNASSSSSSSKDHTMNAPSDVDTDDEDDIGEDTILDDDSGITQAQATKAYERYKEQKAQEAEASKREQDVVAEKKRVEAEEVEQRRQTKAEADRKRQEKADAVKRRRQEKAEADQKRNEEAEVEVRNKEEAARRKLETEEALKKNAEEKRIQMEELEREREAQQETKMQAARLELEALTKRLAEKSRLAAVASQPNPSQVDVIPDVTAGPSATIAQEADDGRVSSDTESESDDPTSREDAVEDTPTETAQPGLTPQAAAALVASPIAPVVVAPASQEVDGSGSSSSDSASSGSDDESSSSDEDDTAKVTDTPDPTPLQAVQAVTSIPRPAHLPSSSPEPYSDIEDVEDEAPRQQKNRRRTQRSPSTDALIPEGDDDDDDDASSIEATQPLLQLSQLQEDIETADERDEREDQMEVDVVEDFPLPGPRLTETETEALALARQATPELTDPDATEDEDEEDGSPQRRTPIANVKEISPPLSVQASPVSKPAALALRTSRRSFADLADDFEASSSAVPSTGNQVFFQALQTEADVDEAGIRDAASELAVRNGNDSAQPIANGDNQLVSDQVAAVQESQSDSMPDSTPTPAPNSRKSKLKAREALIAQAAELAALNADSRNHEQSKSSKSTHDAEFPPPLRTEEERAELEPSAAPTSQTESAEEVASSMEIEVPIAPLPKRRGRPPKAKAPDAASAGSQMSNGASSSQAASSSQDTHREVVGSSISPKHLAFDETINPPASVTTQSPVPPSASSPSLSSTSAPVSASPSIAAPPSKSDLIYQRKEDLRSRRRVGTKPCLICDAIPAHLQKDCPVVIRGLPSVEKRLKELKDTGASSMTIDALQGWVVRLSNKSQQVNKSASPVVDTPNKTNATSKANGSQPSIASMTNGTTSSNGTPLSKRRPGVATRNNIPTLSSLRADALRKPRLAGGIAKDAVTTPTVEKASPFLRRGEGSDDEESSSGTDSDSDDDGKGPALPASLAGRMANGIKTAKKAAVGAIGW